MDEIISVILLLFIYLFLFFFFLWGEGHKLYTRGRQIFKYGPEGNYSYFFNPPPKKKKIKIFFCLRPCVLFYYLVVYRRV
jgi:hypothetical protein